MTSNLYLAFIDVSTLIPIAVTVVAFICFIAFIGFLFKSFYRKIEQGQALIINKMNSIAVSFTGAIIWPIIYKAETMDISVQTIKLERKKTNGLICKDNIRADIEVSFYIRVNQEAKDVLKVAQTVGCERASDSDKLNELFGAKFSEALKTVGKQMDFETLFTERDQLKSKVLQTIGEDLNGYKLEDVAIDYLEQTSITDLVETNIMDAQGIRKITELTAKEAIVTNETRNLRAQTIKKQDVAAQQAILELDKQAADATNRQIREIETTKAKEHAATEITRSTEFRRSEEAKIASEEAVEIARENKDRQVQVAAKNKERTIAVETERVKRDQELEAVERERVVSLKSIEKERALEIEQKGVEEAKRERVIVEKATVKEQESMQDTIANAGAERSKMVALTKANEIAQTKVIQETTAAKAKEEAARHLAEEQIITADARLKTSTKDADAKKAEAEGIIALESASGIAEARVSEAKAKSIELTGAAEAKSKEAIGVAEAKALEAEGSAVATSLRNKGEAEANSINVKADAMRKYDEVGRDHEEFKLRLGMDERIRIAQIDAEKQALIVNGSVLAEAMKNIKVDIIGGDVSSVTKIIDAATLGKTIDRGIKSSTVLSALTDGGNKPEELIRKVKEMIDTAGLTTDSIKNLSVAALLSKLAQDKRTEADASSMLAQLPASLGGTTIKDIMALWLAK